MFQVLFIVWRESIEALLVVGILYAWLKNTAQSAKALRYLWSGVIFGVLLAILLGASLLGFSQFLSGDAQTYFQIGMMLFAAALIIQMVFWMKKHGRDMQQNMKETVQNSVETGTWWGVFFLVVLAIAREGSEMAVFLYGIASQQTISSGTMILGGVLGLLAAFLTIYLFQLGGKIFSWKNFFKVTEVLLLLLAAGLILSGTERLLDLCIEQSDYLSSLDFIDSLTAPVWDTSWLLSDTSTIGGLFSTLVGYRSHPTLFNIVIYIIYWLAILVAYKTSSRHHDNK